MLTDKQLREGAATLTRAFTRKRQEPPLSATFPDMDITDAYRIQKYYVAERLKAGQSVRGYKVGLTSKAMQEVAGVDEPDYGAILDEYLIENGAIVAAERFIRPAVEVEIAFVMKHSLRGPGITFDDVVAATDYVLPAIEVVDFRLEFKGRRKGILDTVADMASCGAVVLGGTPVRLAEIDMGGVSGDLIKNGETVESGSATAVLGNPVHAVAWLANKLHAIAGTTFEPGQVILSGSFTRVAKASPGDRFQARFQGGLGTVEFCISELEG